MVVLFVTSETFSMAVICCFSIPVVVDPSQNLGVSVVA